MRGCLIAFEGTEGSGKSSQIRRTFDWLGPGMDIVITREPGGTPAAESIRSLVLGLSEEQCDPATDAFLMNAARHDHCRRVITPALERNAVVLTDRFAASTRAYQGAGDGVSIDWLAELEDFATGGVRPNRNVLFDVDVEVGLARRRGAGELNSIDRRDLAFHRRVRSGYHDLVQAAPDAWTVIDAGANEETVWAQLRVVIATELTRFGFEPPA